MDLYVPEKCSSPVSSSLKLLTEIKFKKIAYAHKTELIYTEAKWCVLKTSLLRNIL